MQNNEYHSDTVVVAYTDSNIGAITPMTRTP